MHYTSTPIARIHFLDSLRGIAALVVVFHHFMVFNAKELENVVSVSFISVLQFISDLNVEAVLFFFVISGFSIGLAQRGKLLNNRAETNVYFYKRFKRILPIYWIALGLATLVGFCINALQEESYGLINLFGNLIFLQTSVGATDYWFSPYGKNGPLWSLAYEMFFYTLFPFFSIALLKIKLLDTKVFTFGILLLCTLACIIVNKYFIFIPPLAFLSYFIIWWAGFQVAIEYLNRKPDFIFWGTIGLVCMGILIFHQHIPSASILEISKSLLILSILYLALFLNLNWFSVFKTNLKKLINKLFCAIGGGSYALYALHYPAFLLMVHFGINWMYQIIYIFVLIILCVLLEKKLTHKKFRMFALNYTFINQNRIG